MKQFKVRAKSMGIRKATELNKFHLTGKEEVCVWRGWGGWVGVAGNKKN